MEADEVRCGVIGLGFIGSVLMNALITAGLEAYGYDRTPAAVARCRLRTAGSADAARAMYAVDTDPGVMTGCNVIFIAVRNLVDGGQINEEPLQSAARLIGNHAHRPCLVILESTVTPGTTRRFAQQIGALNDDGLFLAHAPERLSAGQDHTALRATPHLVAGIDADSTRLATTMLQKLCNCVIPVSVPEVSELSKLLENAFLSVNIGLTSEVTRLCMSLGIRAQEVCRAAASKPHGFMPFYPGAGLGGHCLPNDLILLASTARSFGWEPELLSAAIAANERAPHLVIERLEQLLAALGQALRGAHILLVGVGFKTGSPDTTRSPAIDVVRCLRARGAAVMYVDRLNPGFTVDGEQVREIPPQGVRDHRFAAGLLLSGESTLAAPALSLSCDLVLDAGGSRSKLPPLPTLETL